jgi:hypothetical protein
MTAFLWFVAGLWVGVGAGFLLFACLQVSRDAERAAEVAPGGVILDADPQFHAGDVRPVQRRILSPSELASITVEIAKIKALAAANGRARELL